MYGIFFTWKMPLAASLHGPGTPGESTSLRPDIFLASSTLRYSAIVLLLIFLSLSRLRERAGVRVLFG